MSINFDATTAKFDVTWQLRFDYTANGKQVMATIPSASQSFQTDAIAPGDSWLTLRLSPNGSTWSALMQTAAQKHAQDQREDETSVDYDYTSLSTDQADIEHDLSPQNLSHGSGEATSHDLAKTRQDEQRVLAESQSADNATVCNGAQAVDSDAQRVADDADDLAGPSTLKDLYNLDGDASALANDLQSLLQVDPGFNGDGTSPPAGQIRQFAKAVLALEAKDATRVNPLIVRANNDITQAYSYASAAASAGHGCPQPDSPVPLSPVGQS